MGEQRERDSKFFYHLDELRELTGYTRKRLNEITKRYRKRRNAEGKKQRAMYLEEAQITNDKFSNWLLDERFYAPLTHERPHGAVMLKKAGVVQEGLSYDCARRFVRIGKLEACVYRGCYYIKRTVLEELGKSRCTQAPANWLPMVHLTILSGRTRQAVWEWVKRRSQTRTFVHPKRAQPAQYLPVQDALDYLARALGSTHAAINLLRRHAHKYFRALSKRTVELFSTAKPAEQLEPMTLELTFTTGESQPPPLNPSRLGHELLSLRT